MEGFSRGNPPAHWHSIDTQTRGPMAPFTAATGGVLAANTCYYAPLMVKSPVIVKKLWFYSHTTGTGNYDIGLYDASGVALVKKGSTAKTTDSTEMFWDCTDTAIAPGIYYIALATDSGTDTFFRIVSTAPFPTAIGIWTEATFPLPATATFAAGHANTLLPVMGMLLDTRYS